MAYLSADPRSDVITPGPLDSSIHPIHQGLATEFGINTKLVPDAMMSLSDHSGSDVMTLVCCWSPPHFPRHFSPVTQLNRAVVGRAGRRQASLAWVAILELPGRAWKLVRVEFICDRDPQWWYNDITDKVLTSLSVHLEVKPVQCPECSGIWAELGKCQSAPRPAWWRADTPLVFCHSLPTDQSSPPARELHAWTGLTLPEEWVAMGGVRVVWELPSQA